MGSSDTCCASSDTRGRRKGGCKTRDVKEMYTVRTGRSTTVLRKITQANDNGIMPPLEVTYLNCWVKKEITKTVPFEA